MHIRILHTLSIGENLGVANSAILSIWFEGKELAFAFGLNLSVARLGSVINNLVSPALANSTGIQFALWFGVILCGSSIAAVVVIGSVDRYVDTTIEPSGHHALLVDQDEPVRKPSTSTSAKAIDASTVNDVNAINEGRRLSRSSSLGSKNEVKEEITMKDLYTFKHVFWVLAVICVVVYGKLVWVWV